MELSVRAVAKAEALPLALVVQSLNVLAMDACSLEESIQNTLLENPLLEAAPGIDNQVKDYLFAPGSHRAGVEGTAVMDWPCTTLQDL